MGGHREGLGGHLGVQGGDLRGCGGTRRGQRDLGETLRGPRWPWGTWRARGGHTEGTLVATGDLGSWGRSHRGEPGSHGGPGGVPQRGPRWPQGSHRGDPSPHPDLPRPPLPPALPCQLHPSPLKRSLSLVPGSPQGGGPEWVVEGDETPVPHHPPFGDHAPLSPQSSVASSGSKQTEEPAGGRNTFQEDGSGMKGGVWGFVWGGEGVVGTCHPVSHSRPPSKTSPPG